ncbi:MAG: FAD-dependent oxidoreductase [Rubrimonas sp.]
MARDVAVIGAGVGGLFAAAALAARGHDVTVFEQAQRIAEVGAGIQISPNGTRLLDHVGALTVLLGHAVEPPAITFRDGVSGSEFLRMPLGEAARRRWRAAYLHVHRADLIAALNACATNMGVDVRLGQAVESADPDGSICVRGRCERFDLVVAANGARSAVRRHLFDAPEPRFTGHVAWRALLDARAVDAAGAPDGAVVWQGSGAHVVTYRVSGGRALNVVAVAGGQDWVDESWSIPAVADELDGVFRGWAVSPLLREIDHCWKWGLFETPPPMRWRNGRVVLLGDACHPMLPFLAQGAVQALEDGATLARLLGEDADFDSVLDSYGAERQARVIRVQKTARANGALFHAGPSPRRAIMRLAMATVSRLPPAALMAQFDWLFGHDASAAPFR